MGGALASHPPRFVVVVVVVRSWRVRDFCERRRKAPDRERERETGKRRNILCARVHPISLGRSIVVVL